MINLQQEMTMGVHQVIGLKAGSVTSIEAELAKLNAQGLALVDEIERLEAAEREPEDDGEMLKAMAATRVARNRLAKLDTQIVGTRQRLDAAKAASRSKELAALRVAHERAKADYLASARKTYGLAQRVIAAREAIGAAGFRSEYDNTPPPPMIGQSAVLAPDLLDNYEARRAGGVASTGLSGPPLRQVAQPQPSPARERGNGSTFVSLAWDPEGAAKPTKRPPLREIAGEGEGLFIVIRGCADHPRGGGVQIRPGDAVALTNDEAMPLRRSGLLETTTPEELAAIDAANALSGPAPKEAAE